MPVTVPNQNDSSPVFQWRVQSEIADSEHAVEDDIMSIIWKACSFVLDPYRTTIFVLFFFFFFFFLTVEVKWEQWFRTLKLETTGKCKKKTNGDD